MALRALAMGTILKESHPCGQICRFVRLNRVRDVEELVASGITHQKIGTIRNRFERTAVQLCVPFSGMPLSFPGIGLTTIENRHCLISKTVC